MQKSRSALFLALLPAMAVPFLASLFYFVLFKDARATRVMYACSKVFMLLWPIFAVTCLLHDRLPNPLAGGKRILLAVTLGAVTGILIAGTMILVTCSPIGEVLKRAAPNIRNKADQLGILDHYWLFALAISLLHSLLEEYYWRWFVFGFLRRIVGTKWAAIISSAAFAAHHVVVLLQFFTHPWAFFFGTSVGVGGIVWCVLYQKQRTLAGAWSSHAIVDVAIFLVGHMILRAG